MGPRKVEGQGEEDLLLFDTLLVIAALHVPGEKFVSIQNKSRFHGEGSLVRITGLSCEDRR